MNPFSDRRAGKPLAPNLFGMAITTLFVSADSTFLAVPRTDSNSRRAHQELLEKKGKGRIDVYFAGDSITRRWGCSDAQYRDLLANWQANFFGWNAANFGWGGDTVQNITNSYRTPRPARQRR
jgi:hypothetical protein